MVFAALLTLLLVGPLATQAQQTYTTGLGLRGGYPSGITVKHFVSPARALEGIVSFGWGSLWVTGLYQIHLPIPDAPGFRWYYGLGGHLGMAFDEHRHNPYTHDGTGAMYLGFCGVIGAEYTFAQAPITISLDVIPTLNLVPVISPWFHPGFSIRYNF